MELNGLRNFSLLGFLDMMLIDVLFPTEEVASGQRNCFGLLIDSVCNVGFVKQHLTKLFKRN